MISTLFLLVFFFFFNDTATTEIYTLSLHDALPISRQLADGPGERQVPQRPDRLGEPRRVPAHRLPERGPARLDHARSEEPTAERQSPCNLVCRLLLAKKNPTGLRVPLDIDMAPAID